MAESNDSLSPEKTLKTAKLLWYALIAGQFVFLAAAMFLASRQGPIVKDPGTIQTLFYVSIFAVVFAVFLGHVFRMQSYKSGWNVNIISPRAYLKGNLIFWGLCEAASTFGIIVVLLAAQFWPYIGPSVLALGVMISSKPNGKAMKPAEPELLNNR